jgi:hypothetical protein
VNIRVETISKQEFVDAGRTAYSVIGHPEIAEMFGLPLNRESVTLERGDVMYVVNPSRRPNEGMTVENGCKYQFIPESEGYVYKRVTLE